MFHSYSSIIANTYTNPNTYNDAITRVSKDNSYYQGNDNRKNPLPPVGPKPSPSIKSPRKFKTIQSIKIASKENVIDNTNGIEVSNATNNASTTTATTTTNNNNNNNNDNSNNNNNNV